MERENLLNDNVESEYNSFNFSSGLKLFSNSVFNILSTLKLNKYS